jgi:hypothetical protein
MREKHGIAVADPLVEIDRPFRRIGAEVGGGVVDAKAHCHILPVKLAARLGSPEWRRGAEAGILRQAGEKGNTAPVVPVTAKFNGTD